MIELPFRPDATADEPLYRQLEGYLRDLVESGRMPAGTKLPATRELAAAIGVGRVTVVQAYERLLAEGVLRARVGQGTFVAPRESPPEEAGGALPRRFAWSGLFAARARELRVPPGMEARPPAGEPSFDFVGGQVDRDSMPLTEVRRAFERGLRRYGGELASHGDPYGWKPLRHEIARLLVARGIRADPSEILVVSGAQQAIDLVARALVDPGDTVAIEEPGYFGAALAFRAAQANLVGVRVDDEGLDTAELDRVLRSRRVKLVFVTPAVQSAIAERRKAA